ncbi:MAG: hypothetical protein RR404_01250 [Bacilli bacterium]
MNKFTIVKKTNEQTAQIDSKKMQGFNIKPLNKVDYEGVKVNQMLIIKPSFIEKILKRKIKRKLEVYLQFIISMLDDSDTDAGKIEIALNDITRYKSIIKNNYRVYLDELYFELLIKKIDVIENELKVKAQYLIMTAQDIYEKKGKSR